MKTGGYTHATCGNGEPAESDLSFPWILDVFELAHYCLFFLDYVGVAVYQYGCALGHYFYGSEAAWRAGPPGPAFLPAATTTTLLFETFMCACITKPRGH